MPTHPIEMSLAEPGDAPQLREWMRDFNAGEGIDVDPDAHDRALLRLLREPALGRVWIARLGAEAVGYAVVTFNFDLEYPGLDAFLTELYVIPAARRRGIAMQILAQVEARLRALDVVALNLAVRPDNAPALALYEAAGFQPWLRRVLGKALDRSARRILATGPVSGP